MRTHARKYQGRLHSVIIDGIGDLVTNPNSEEECFPLIMKLHGFSEMYHCPIVVVLHLNPSVKEDKSRGHLGSQLERKAQTVADDPEVTLPWPLAGWPGASNTANVEVSMPAARSVARAADGSATLLIAAYFTTVSTLIRSTAGSPFDRSRAT